MNVQHAFMDPIRLFVECRRLVDGQPDSGSSHQQRFSVKERYMVQLGGQIPLAAIWHSLFGCIT